LFAQQSFYQLLNDFISTNGELLDSAFSFLFKQKGLLNFHNKLMWLRRHLPFAQQWVSERWR
jgi:hypothetical protein